MISLVLAGGLGKCLDLPSFYLQIHSKIFEIGFELLIAFEQDWRVADFFGFFEAFLRVVNKNYFFGANTEFFE